MSHVALRHGNITQLFQSIISSLFYHINKSLQHIKLSLFHLSHDCNNKHLLEGKTPSVRRQCVTSLCHCPTSFLKHLVYIEKCLKPKMFGSTISALQRILTSRSPCSEMSAHQTVPTTKSPKFRTPKAKNLTPKRKLRRFKQKKVGEWISYNSNYNPQTCMDQVGPGRVEPAASGHEQGLFQDSTDKIRCFDYMNEALIATIITCQRTILF